MSNLLEQAQEAAQQGNWALLNSCLQQILLSDQTETEIQTDEVELLLPMGLSVLEAGDFHDRWEIAKVFPIFGASAIAPLVGFLQDEDADLETRWFAARILSTFDHPAAIQALIDVLQDSEDEDLSTMAAEALANLGNSAIAVLTNLLVDDKTRFLGVQSLAQIRHSLTIEPLLSVVDDSEPTVRLTAIDALGSFHDSRVLPALLSALKDPESMARIAAIQGLGVRSDLADELNIVDRLSECLWDLNQQVCQQAAISLGRLGTDAAVESLFRALKSPHTPIPLQIEVVRALGWIGTPNALDSLRQAFSLLQPLEPDSTVFQEIITVLGRWSNSELKPRAAQILMDVLSSNHPAVSHAAVKQSIALSLGHLEQPQAFESLIQLLVEEDMGIRLHAIAALKTLDAQASRQRLELLANQADVSEALRQGVTIALREWDL